MTHAHKHEASLFKPYPRLAPCIFIVTAILIAYFNIYNNTFLFDDGIIITLNDYLKSWHHLPELLTSSTTSGAHIKGGFYRPLQIFLYLIIYQIQGPIPFGFHCVNVILHALNACMIYLLGRKLQFKDETSFFAALLWALHPIHTEAITYISGTADPLFTFFCLLGCLVLLPDFSIKRTLLASLCMLMALLSKETAAVFPFLAILLLYFAPNVSIKKYQGLIRLFPLVVAAFVYSYWRIYVSNYDGPLAYYKLFDRIEFSRFAIYSHHFLFRVWTFFATLPAYASLIVWPHDLHMERDFFVATDPYNVFVVMGLLMFVAAGTVILTRRDQLKPFGFGILWFGINYAPNCGLIFPINALFLEHWMYAPTSGLFLGLLETVQRESKKYFYRFKYIRFVGFALALTICAIFGFLTYNQNKIWRDPITFYSHVLKYGETTARVHNNLAIAYIDNKEFDKAIEEFHNAIKVSDNYAETHYNLAIALLNLPNQTQNSAEAIAELKLAIGIDPHFYRSYNLLALIYEKQGDKDKADFYKNKAIETKNEFNQ